MKNVYLVLENGEVFEGQSFGAEKSEIGEIVFTTGMNGYIETLTDESYYGQIVVQTFPLIGNYGIIPEDFEGECCVKGYIVRDYCEHPSNFRCQMTLDTFLKQKGIPAVCGIDTRKLTKIIREYGVMNAIITDSIPSDLEKVKAYRINGALDSVSSKEKTEYKAEEEKFKVALIDYGAKRNIIRELNKRGCTVTVYPCKTPAAEIKAANPDGIMLSNGPGDPSDNAFEIEQIKELAGKFPIFGICLGHQLLALANGAETGKLKYGHRGVNQPVKDLNGGRTYITSQNHGYAVLPETVKSGKISFINANDGTCEGIDYDEINAFSVQFHPEACSGPHDTEFLFDRFINIMEKHCKNNGKIG